MSWFYGSQNIPCIKPIETEGVLSLAAISILH